MESPPSPGLPAASFPCPAISYSRYQLFPTTTGLLKEPLQATIHNDRMPLYSSVRPQVLGYGSAPRERESTAAGAPCLPATSDLPSCE